jgi:glucose/arabinose dehydrogenase
MTHRIGRPMRTDRVAALLLATAVMFAACGGDDGPIESGPPVTFATQSTGPLPATDVTGPPTGPSTGEGTAPSPPAQTGETPAPMATPSTQPAVPLGDPVVALSPIGTFDSPIDLAWRAGDPTLFVVGQGGIVVPVRDGQVGATVLDISDLTTGGGEQGLLGLTFSPDGAIGYINHTDNNGDTVIASYTVSSDGVFDAASRVELLMIDQPYPNHNGGNVTIGPDGMLYIGMGDGGSGGDPQRHALNVTSLLGKILRIDPTSSGDAAYTVPPDNPFVGVEGVRPEIWAVGVRNPWRMSFDPATADLWFGDVGQGAVEEVDVAWAADGGGRGLNFGWSALEGTSRYNQDQSPDGATPPIYEYNHGEAGCSISGGAVYRGAAIPALTGWYVFADYCSGIVSALQVRDRVLVKALPLTQMPSVTAVRAGPDGELYVLSIDGTVALIIGA